RRVIHEGAVRRVVCYLHPEMSSIGTTLIVLVAVLAAVALGVALAYVPLRLLLGQMARSVRVLIERQRERRRLDRTTPDRRKAG
ncbi:MAG: hypothetical protein WA208_10075, partial [Thermoanaerobaculia bacterium]